jgi:hypothetical protein
MFEFLTFKFIILYYYHNESNINKCGLLALRQKNENISF